ncbi:MAG: FadD3 family acyl-CoA ligase [Acidimicrobiales bacterium]|nr:FadD3 family acyl-CoA ligase [Acidimicrobiales bacterium]
MSQRSQPDDRPAEPVGSPMETGVRGDLEWGTTPALVLSAAARLGDRPAIVDGDLTISFADLAARVEHACRAFLAAGVEAGDRVSIWAPNLWEWIVTALGLHAAGGVLVPLNTRFKGHEAGYVLEKSGARLLFTVTGFLDTDYVALLRDALGGPDGDRPVAGLDALDRIVVLRGEAPLGTQSFADFLEEGGSVSAADARARAASVRPGDLSDILFTSGTTGKPKGVMTAHGQNLRAFYDWATVVGLREGDRYLIINPFFHAFGYKAGILASLMKGATIYPQPVFDVPEVMQRVARERITMLPGPPTLYQTILNHPDFESFDLSSLRLAVTGAAAIPVELILRMRDELTFETIITGYGLTEACGIATMCRFDDDPETIATTSGRAIPDVEVRCVDDDGNEVPRGEPGEVVVRGYNVMLGYLDEPEETAATIDENGWLHTGDIGVMDERGYLKITDRKKDMFIVGGFNAYPAEIENLMLANDKIAQVAVVGVPDERLGEVGCAFVVLRPGAAATGEEIVAWCRERMANYKVPRRVEIVESLPMNATGKVLKYELREWAAKGGV